MEIKRFAKLSALLPIIIGLIIGVTLFILGDMDDAPGLSLIGLVAAFCLIMLGINNAGVINKGFLVPILLLCFGAGGILVSIVLLFDGEFEENPGMAFIGVALGVALIFVGAVMIRRKRQ